MLPTRNCDVFGALSKSRFNSPVGTLLHLFVPRFPRIETSFTKSLRNLYTTVSNHPFRFVQRTKAGFPASGLLLGLAIHGYVRKSNAKKLSDRLLPHPAVSFGDQNPSKELSAALAGDLGICGDNRLLSNDSCNLARYK